MFLMQHDSDGFNRWDAGQQLSVQVLQELIGQHQRGEALALDTRLLHAFRTLLEDESLDQAMVAEMLSLPSEAYLSEISEVADVDAIHAAREFTRRSISDALFPQLLARYQANRALSRETPYVASAEHFARRTLQNIALSYLMLSGKVEILDACLEQFEACDNMTERLTALSVLVNSGFEAEKAKALAGFAEHFKDNPLVMDQWFSVQAGSTLPGGLERVQALMGHKAFTLKNPNKVRADRCLRQPEPGELPPGRWCRLSLPRRPRHHPQRAEPADRLAPAGAADPLAQVRRGAAKADARRAGAHPRLR